MKNINKIAIIIALKNGECSIDLVSGSRKIPFSGITASEINARKTEALFLPSVVPFFNGF